MSFLPVMLWSDALIWLLVLAALGLGWFSRRSPSLCRSWGRLGKNAVAMGAATVLCAFLLVGLLDSLHYRLRLPSAPGQQAEAIYSVEVLSVLDYLLKDLRDGHEKTYSAPFASRLYAKETLETPEGMVRDFPRLKYGGAHLKDESALMGDVMKRGLYGVFDALLIWMHAFIFLGIGVGINQRKNIHSLMDVWSSIKRKEILGRESRRAILRGETAIAWRGVLLALGGLLIVFLPLALLSGDYHVFGTDKVGQDVFYQILKSVRTALVIGLVTTLVTLPVAIGLGILAGYFRGWIDDAIQYLYTTLSSIPGVLLIAASVLMMQVVIDTHPQWFSSAAERADLRLLALCFILGLTGWPSLCRLLRGETLKLRELEYIQAAQAFGVADLAILRRHILPNLMHIVIIALVMDFSGLVLAEAVLSYVGIGVDPTMISFGTMINSARMELSREPAVWWSLVSAFIFMFTLVLAANLLADAVRDAFDPRMG
ncbi:oligopeptide transport integral membrane protein [Betaproteobacteria bacterium]|nr:oligopeptide transport integral membrane protein [Betaproteobacteria bacterium]